MPPEVVGKITATVIYVLTEILQMAANQLSPVGDKLSVLCLLCRRDAQLLKAALDKEEVTL